MALSWNEKIWLGAGRHVCPICGKEFYVELRNEWCYKINHTYYCSYKCYRAAAPKQNKLKGERVEK